MKKSLFTFIFLFFCVTVLFAQTRIAGVFDREINSFRPADANILVRECDKEGLAPFMIKGKNPFDQSDNRVGFIDTAGNIIIKPAYINCSGFKDGYAIVALEKRRYQKIFGLIDKKGHIIIPVMFSELSICTNGLFMVKKDTTISFINANGKPIVPFGKYTAFAMPHPYYWESTDDVGHPQFKWDLIPFFQYVQFDKYIGVKTGKKWAVINRTGKEIIPPTFDGIEIFIGDEAPVKIGEKFGAINAKGQIIIPGLYDQVNLTGKNYAFVKIGYNTGVMSTDNRLLIPILYNRIEKFGNGFTAFTSENKAVLYDADGNQISQAIYADINFPVWGNPDDGFFVHSSADNKYHPYKEVLNFSSGAYPNYLRHIFYNQDEKWGLLDTSGKEITPAIYDDFDDVKLSHFDGERKLIVVEKDDKWGIINAMGSTVLKVDYEQIIPDRGKLFVKKDGKCGFFNSKLQQLTRIKYDSLVVTDDVTFHVNLKSNIFVRARIGKKWGLINNVGKEIVPIKYDELVWIYYNVALVKNNGKYGLVDTLGKQIVDCIYDDINFNDKKGGENYYDKHFITRQANLYGIVNAAGLLISPPIYENITPLLHDFIGKYQVTNHGKKGMLDGANGKLSIPCLYDNIMFYNDYGNDYLPQAHRNSPYITAVKNGYYGFTDSIGAVHLPFVYERIYFRFNNYLLELNEKQGLVGKDMKWIIPLKYYRIEPYSYTVFKVYSADGIGFINVEGHVIADAIYERLEFCGNHIIARKDDKFGVIDINGKVVTPFIYSLITCENSKLVEKP
jgi:hypothetical protein